MQHDPLSFHTPFTQSVVFYKLLISAFWGPLQRTGDFLWVCCRSHLLVPNRSYVTFDIKKSAMWHGEISLAGNAPGVGSPHRRRLRLWCMDGSWHIPLCRTEMIFGFSSFGFHLHHVNPSLNPSLFWMVASPFSLVHKSGRKRSKSKHVIGWYKLQLMMRQAKYRRLLLTLLCSHVACWSQLPLHCAKHFTRRTDNEVRCVLIDSGKSTALRYIAQTNWDLSWQFFMRSKTRDWRSIFLSVANLVLA